MRGELIARYLLYFERGWVEDVDGYAQTLTVERDMTNPNRLNSQDEIIIIGNLRITAMKLGYDFAS
jgi:phage tail sheath gpL-like